MINSHQNKSHFGSKVNHIMRLIKPSFIYMNTEYYITGSPKWAKIFCLSWSTRKVTFTWITVTITDSHLQLSQGIFFSDLVGLPVL